MSARRAVARLVLPLVVGCPALTAAPAEAGVIALESTRCTDAELAAGNGCWSNRIWRVDDDASGLEPLGPGTDPSWSADGQWLLHLRYEGHPPEVPYSIRFWVMRPDGSEARPVTSDLEIGELSWHHDSDWSPDGRYVVFAARPDSASPPDDELYLLDLAGGAPRRLTRSHGVEMSASFSPDGTRVAFVRSNPGQGLLPGLDAGVHVLELSSGRELPLVLGPTVPNEPNFYNGDVVTHSPDGRFLAFTFGQSAFTIAVDGSDLRQRGPAQTGYNRMAWSGVGPALIFPHGQGALHRLPLTPGASEPEPFLPPSPTVQWHGDGGSDWTSGQALPPVVDIAPPGVQLIRPETATASARELAFIAADPSGVARVEVAVGRRIGRDRRGRPVCRFVRPGRSRSRRCSRPAYTRVHDAATWRALMARTRPGRHQIRFRSADGRGNETSTARPVALRLIR